MKTSLANASRTCPAWCARHDNEPDVCRSAIADLDFRAGRRSVDTAEFADVFLSHCDEEGTTVWLDVAGIGSTHFELEHARQLAEAILEKVRQAESALIPGPRSSTEDGCAVTSSPIRIVIPMDVIGDEIPPTADRAAAQRAEIHVGLSDAALEALAVRGVYPRRPLWRRITTRIGGAK